MIYIMKLYAELWYHIDCIWYHMGMISCMVSMISCIGSLISWTTSYHTSWHTSRSGPKSDPAGSWPLGRASALLLSHCYPLSNAARYGPLASVPSVSIADSSPPVGCCPRSISLRLEYVYYSVGNLKIALTPSTSCAPAAIGACLTGSSSSLWAGGPDCCTILEPPGTIPRACSSRRPCSSISWPRWVSRTMPSSAPNVAPYVLQVALYFRIVVSLSCSSSKPPAHANDKSQRVEISWNWKLLRFQEHLELAPSMASLMDARGCHQWLRRWTHWGRGRCRATCTINHFIDGALWLHLWTRKGTINVHWWTHRGRGAKQSTVLIIKWDWNLHWRFQMQESLRRQLEVEFPLETISNSLIRTSEDRNFGTYNKFWKLKSIFNLYHST